MCNGSLQPKDHTAQRIDGGQGSGDLGVRDPKEGEQQDSSYTHHQFTVQVEGIRALEVAANTVWGEADCFIQYHFPALSEESDGEDSSQNGESGIS
jgi:hypothetical protein